MKHETNIRPVHLGDLPALQQIGRQTFFETFAHTCTEADMQAYLTKSFAEAQLAAELNNPHSAFYFFEAQGQVLGYLKLNFAQAQTELQDANAMEIERIYVLNASQGQGIGQALFQYALNTARQQQTHYIWLGVWEHNHKALRFYEKNGFVPFGKHTFHVGGDAQTDIMMKLELLHEVSASHFLAISCPSAENYFRQVRSISSTKPLTIPYNKKRTPQIPA